MKSDDSFVICFFMQLTITIFVNIIVWTDWRFDDNFLFASLSLFIFIFYCWGLPFATIVWCHWFETLSKWKIWLVELRTRPLSHICMDNYSILHLICLNMCDIFSCYTNFILKLAHIECYMSFSSSWKSGAQIECSLHWSNISLC